MEKKRIIVYGVFILAMLVIIFLPEYSELHKLREENQQYKRRINLLEEHNDVLEEELTKLQEDPDYIEREARKKLGVVRKGEIIYHQKTKNTEEAGTY